MPAEHEIQIGFLAACAAMRLEAGYIKDALQDVDDLFASIPSDPAFDVIAEKVSSLFTALRTIHEET